MNDKQLVNSALARLVNPRYTLNMWQCPKCGGNFKNTGQHHFCVKITTIDEYIAGQAENVRPLLQEIRECIHAAAPDAVEKISWQMPTFWQGENLIHFAAFKKHIGLFPGDLTDSPFAEKLASYHTSKGTIHFPLNKPPDFELIADITRWRVNSVVRQPSGFEQLPLKNNNFVTKRHEIARLVRQPTGLSNKSNAPPGKNMAKNDNALIANLDKVHTTVMGAERIKRNLKTETEDCVGLCIEKIKEADTITRKGKNWYARCADCVITVNAQSYTIITAHKTG